MSVLSEINFVLNISVGWKKNGLVSGIGNTLLHGPSYFIPVLRNYQFVKITLYKLGYDTAHKCSWDKSIVVKRENISREIPL